MPGLSPNSWRLGLAMFIEIATALVVAFVFAGGSIVLLAVAQGVELRFIDQGAFISCVTWPIGLIAGFFLGRRLTRSLRDHA